MACDSIQNHADTEGASLLARWTTPLLGFTGGLLAPTSMWRRLKKLDADGVKRAYAPVAELSFQNLITGHGPAIVGGADAQLRDVLTRLG